MKLRRYQIVLRRDARLCLSLDAAASCAGVHPALVELLMEHDIVQPMQAEPVPVFDVSIVPRLRMIERLRCDLGINLAGVAVIVDMLDRMQALQLENAWLRDRISEAGSWT